MCGIAGVAGVPAPRAMLAAMSGALRHRGPDDEGFFVGSEGALAFRRLSILDLESGRQPMGNEDGKVQVVFNGEIYNHRELRLELEARGHRFASSHSDTEVIVHGWEEWGRDLFPRLNAMLAAAIWDERTRTLVLARDRFGIKPLYYAALPGGGLVFASEVRAIHASGLLPREPDAAGVVEYFSFQNLWGEPTMFRGVRQLEAGSTLTWRGGDVRSERYWDITFPRRRRGSLASLAEEHRTILQRAIRRQLAADVPVMSYLSGGIDSTAITVAAYRQDPDVTAYSCVFDLDGVTEDRGVDEREFSRRVAEAYRLRRVEMEIAPDALAACMGGYVSALEDLRMGMGYPVYLIAKRVADDAKVVLSGTGGDEFHGGYVGRYDSLGLTGGGGLTRGWRAGLRGMLARPGSPEGAYRKMLNFVVEKRQFPSVFTPEFLAATGGFDADEAIDQVLGRCPSPDWRDRVMYVDARTYLVGLLVLEDKLSMAHSLETRVPLLDNELVDFVLDVPFSYLCRDGTGKVLFRESVRPWVPPEIYAKPKMGFGPPDASWYRGALRPWIEATLSEERCRERGVFQPAYVRSVLDEHFSGRANRTYLIWSLLSFEAWCQAFGFFGAARAVPEAVALG